MRAALLAALISLPLALNGCSAMKVADFKDAKPVFKLEEYFAGKSTAYGIFVDRFGTLRRQFKVDIQGDWNGETLTLTEDFHYSDGEKDRRVWTVRKTGPDSYSGTAADVIGVATGTIAGNALNWSYDMNLKVGGDSWKVRFDDWMWQQDEKVMINRAAVTRWGVEIGVVTIFFTRG